MQLAAQWCLAHEPVACVVPTLIQEPGGPARSRTSAPSCSRRPPTVVLDADEVAQIRAIGDNTGSMALKGAGPDHEGEPRPDRWALSPQLDEVARRWGIEPERDLRQLTAARG